MFYLFFVYFFSPHFFSFFLYILLGFKFFFLGLSSSFVFCFLFFYYYFCVFFQKLSLSIFFNIELVENLIL